MSHEKSITIKTKSGKYVNLSTVHRGKSLTEGMAAKAYENGVLKPLGGREFKTLKDAVGAAKSRSKRVDRKVKGR